MKVLKVLGEELDIKLSPSFINNAACPLYLKLHYVDKVDERYVRVAAERGSAAHGAIADLLEFCRSSEIQPVDLSIEMISEAVQKHTPHAIISEVGLVLAWVKLWAARYRISEHLYGFEEKIALDDEFDECEWSKGSYRGILDAIDIQGKHCTITDWKSQPHIVAQSEIDDPNASEIAEQLTFYCWLASKLYPHLETFTIRIWYLRYGFYDQTTRDEEQLEAFEHALMIKEKKIEEIENWDPIPGKHCQYCDFVRVCPLGTDMTSAELLTQEQAVNAASRLTVLDELRKVLQTSLKDYVKKNDNVRTGDNWVYGFHQKESSTWTPEEVAKVLRRHSQDDMEDIEDEEVDRSDALIEQVGAVTSIDARRMKKLLKNAAREDPALEEDLLEIEGTRKYTRFEGFQDRPESE